jgi:hypothetical protein
VVIEENVMEHDLEQERELALRKKELRGKADAEVAADMRTTFNQKNDQVSFFPAW